MKNLVLAFLLVLCFSGAAFAVEGRVTPAIPFDYNGNPAPVIWDDTGWLLDSGAISVVVGITDTVTVHIGDTTTTVNSGDSALLVSGRIDSITDTVTVGSGGTPLSVDSIEDTFGANANVIGGTVAVIAPTPLPVSVADTVGVTASIIGGTVAVVFNDTQTSGQVVITDTIGSNANIIGGTLGDISDSIGAAVEVVNRVTVTLPETATVSTAPYTANTGGTAVFSESVVVPVAINLGSEYNLWEITSDTDCVISPDSATLTPLNGDIVRQYDPFIYPGRLQTVYAVTRTGLIDSAAVIRARGWR